MADTSHRVLLSTTRLSFDSKDFFAHYTLGLAFMTKAQKTQSVAELDPARHHFQTMLQLAPDLAEAAECRSHLSGRRNHPGKGQTRSQGPYWLS